MNFNPYVGILNTWVQSILEDIDTVRYLHIMDTKKSIFDAPYYTHTFPDTLSEPIELVMEDWLENGHDNAIGTEYLHWVEGKTLYPELLTYDCEIGRMIAEVGPEVVDESIDDLKYGLAWSQMVQDNATPTQAAWAALRTYELIGNTNQLDYLMGAIELC